MARQNDDMMDEETSEAPEAIADGATESVADEGGAPETDAVDADHGDEDEDGDIRDALPDASEEEQANAQTAESDDGADGVDGADAAGAEAVVADVQAEAEPGLEPAVADAESAPADGDAAADAPAEPAPEEDGLLLEGIVEAILVAATGPLTSKAIAKMARRKVKPAEIETAIGLLNRFYQEHSRAFEIVCVNESYQIMTLPAYAGILRPEGESSEPETKKLTPAMLDTLAIIAYKQPLMRVDIEEIRGVQCGPALRSLIEYGLVKVTGRREDIPGQPMLYGTTERFLEQFGLARLEELPSIEALRLG